MGTDTLSRRFWSKVDKSGDCWEWAGGLSSGYGMFWLGGRNVGAHRISWMLEHSTRLPDHTFVCHSCDNPKCVRPSHLFLGTPLDNMNDKLAKGRHVAGRLFGDENPRARLTAEQAVEIRNAEGSLRAIAKRFGVTHPTVLNIKRGVTWQTA